MNKKHQRKRIKEIISVFIRHGLTDPAEVRRALEELGPTFIKIGQILSTRPDIVSEPYLIELQKLQDSVKPENYSDIKNIIETDLRSPIDDLFLDFEQEPVASASMAQVHLAILNDGTRVVVKVQRPMARETMLEDLMLLKRITHFMKLTSQITIMNPSEVVDELLEVGKKELDFLNEAENIKKFYKNNKEVKYVTCPYIYDEYTTPNIIVMEYVEGIKIDLINDLIDSGYDTRDIALKLTNNYLKQIFEDGFFHGDPHPGNILIKDRKIAYIDFGIMGSLDKVARDKFNDFLYGAATRDIDIVTRSILRIGIKRGRVNRQKLYLDIEQMYNSYIEASLFDINIPKLMEEISKVCRSNNISMPREITMLVKGIMTIEGIVEKLSPDINIMDIIIPYMKRHIVENRDYKQDFLEHLDDLYNMVKYGAKIPAKLLYLLNSALAGNLKIQMEHTNLEEGFNDLNRMANRIVFGMIVSSIIIGSSVVMNANIGPKVYNIPIIGFAGYAGAAVMGFWLLISIMRSGKM